MDHKLDTKLSKTMLEGVYLKVNFCLWYISEEFRCKSL